MVAGPFDYKRLPLVAPRYINYDSQYINANLAANLAATLRKTIPDDVLWLGLVANATNNNYSIQFYDEGNDDYVFSGATGAGACALNAVEVCGTGIRPFYFPAPRFLRRNSVLRMTLTALSSASNTVYVSLIGVLADPAEVRRWGMNSDRGYKVFSADTAGWTVAANAFAVQTIELCVRYDFAAMVVTGVPTSQALEIEIRDPMGRRRDLSLDRVEQYAWGDQQTHWNNIVGLATTPHWLPLPYIFPAEGRITLRFRELSGVNNVVRIAFHGCKLPLQMDSMAKEVRDDVLREMLRTAYRHASR